MERKTTNKPPYEYFKDNAEAFNEFTARCYSKCEDGGPMSICPILQTLVISILDKEQRWEEGWVKFNKKGYPVCPHCKEKK